MIIKNVLKMILFLLFTKTTIAQEGMNFEQNLHWKDILIKAKTEKKYIFVDCYTTWCGPCKFMTKEIFPKPAVGKFFNDHYINVGLQIDTTVDDNNEIKFQYEDAVYIRNQYSVQGYPTYLYFNPDGELVHKDIGSSNELEFISRGTMALDTLQQYFTQLKKYEMGFRTSLFSKKLALLALGAQETAATAKFAKEYISSSSEVLNNKADVEFIFKTARTVRDTGFILIMKNLSIFKNQIEKEQLYSTLKRIIIESEFAANYSNWNKWDDKKWADYAKAIIKKYPPVGKEVIFDIKINTFQNKENCENYLNTIEKYQVYHKLSNDQLNEFAWNIYLNCSDAKILNSALKLSKASISNKSKIDPNHIDTFANLLFKIGRKKEAIEWEKKAKKMAIKNGADSNWGTDFLHK